MGPYVYVGFFKRRLVRLHLMVVMGTVLGACYYFFAQGEGFAQIGHVSGSLVLAALMAVPCVGGEGNVLNGVYNAVCILLVFPLVVLMGAGSRLTDARSVRVCTFLGELSYPLYITHFLLIYMQMSWVWAHPDAPLYAHVMVSLGVFFLAIFQAWACLKLYDLPVREWLKRHWLMKTNNTTQNKA